jgi:hypothetical protein
MKKQEQVRNLPIKSKHAIMRMANTMLRNHGLGDWEVDVEDWDGSCCEATRSIRIDPRVLRYSRHTVRYILLHEIAHALAGESAGHGPRWQRKARSLGVPLHDIKRHAHLWETREAHRLTAKFDPTLSAWDYRCYDRFPSIAAAEKFFSEAKDLYGVAGIVVYTPDDPIMKLAKHGCDIYPFVLLQEGRQVGGSANYILELAQLAEQHEGVYEYS